MSDLILDPRTKEDQNIFGLTLEVRELAGKIKTTTDFTLHTIETTNRDLGEIKGLLLGRDGISERLAVLRNDFGNLRHDYDKMADAQKWFSRAIIGNALVLIFSLILFGVTRSH